MKLAGIGLLSLRSAAKSAQHHSAKETYEMPPNCTSYIACRKARLVLLSREAFKFKAREDRRQREPESFKRARGRGLTSGIMTNGPRQELQNNDWRNK
jgi:hypothetical protein